MVLTVHKQDHIILKNIPGSAITIRPFTISFKICQISGCLARSDLKLFQTLNSKRSPFIGCSEKSKLLQKESSAFLSTVAMLKTQNNTITCKAK